MGTKRLFVFVFLLFIPQESVSGLQCFDTLSTGQIVPRECMEGAIGCDVETSSDTDGKRLYDHFRGCKFPDSESDDSKPKDAKPPVICTGNRCNSENNHPEKVVVKELQCYVATNYGKIVLDTCPVKAIGCEVQIRKTNDGKLIYDQLRGCTYDSEFETPSQVKCYETKCNSLEKFPAGALSKPVKPTSAPIPQTTKAPALQETVAPPAPKTEAPPPKETEAPPPQETEAPLEQKTEAPPPQETEAPPAPQEAI